MSRRAWGLGAALLAVAGCAHGLTRLQKPDDADKNMEKEAEVKTVGDYTAFGNAEPIPVSGVGLVVGLAGTGGDAPPGPYRQMLEKDLRARKVEHVKELLASPEVSLVLVSGTIPAGAHKGDPFDVDVTLPPQSRTTSLRGGCLRECVLYNYDSTKHLDPNFAGPNRTLLGHPFAKVEGAVLTDLSEGDKPADLRRGHIWGGARSNIERPFYLIVNGDQQRAPVVQRLADRVNETFRGPVRGTLSDVATAKTTSYIVLRVPEQYKHNLQRYLRVVRLIPYDGVPPEAHAYLQRLREQLLDPRHTVTAALRLEALGPDGVSALRAGLEREHSLVRFSSAEALAYLGAPEAGETLARLIEEKPLLRAYCLTALASLDEAVSRVKLRELLAAGDAEARYGAFRALRALDEHEPAVQGELLNNSFWLHHACATASPLVHLSTSRRPEVVLFGREPTLVPQLYFLAGEFTITAGPGDGVCTVSRLSATSGTDRRQCPLALEAVIRSMADMGALYPEIVELLRQVENYQCLNCAIAVDALPQAPSVFELARRGAAGGDLSQPDDQEILKAKDDFGATPSLYEKGARAPAHPAARATASDKPSARESR